MKRNTLLKCIICCLSTLFYYSCITKIDIDTEAPVKSNTIYRVNDSLLDEYFAFSRNIVPSKGDVRPFVEPVLYQGDTVMYLAHYEDGWDLLSSDVRAPRVIAFSTEGDITIEELFANPAVSSFYNSVAEQIVTITNDYPNNWKELQPVETKANWTDWRIYRMEVQEHLVCSQDHLLKTKWNQGYPWNRRAPKMYPAADEYNHCFTGCGPVAVAQVLYYLHDALGYHIPFFGEVVCNSSLPSNASASETLQINLSDIVFDASSYSESYWSLLPLTSSSFPKSSERYDYVSSLMTQIGYYGHSTYSLSGTSNYLSQLKTAFLTFGINAYPGKLSNVYEQIINQKKPCLPLISYYDSNNNYNGHFVVIDGYKKYADAYIAHIMRTDDKGNIERGMKTDHISYREYVAINWGWGGTGDSTSSGATIWYNLDMPWGNYDTFNSMLCAFDN